MIARVVTESEIAGFKELLSESKNILITCHVSPDGDAVGSSLGLMHVLTNMGKTVNVMTPDMVPVSLNFLPGVRDIVVYSRQEIYGKKLLSKADLVICLDFNAVSRVDRMGDALKAAPGKKVMIDHHLGPEDFCDLCISYHKMSSTCELLYHILLYCDMDQYVDKKSAECIYTGMMTDTGNFSYNSNNSDLYLIVAELVKKGVDKDSIYQIVMNTYSADRLKLMGYAIAEKMTVYDGVGGAIITLDKNELARFNYQKGDTESLVNRPLCIPEVHWSIFLREDNDYIKVSARSQGEFAVNTICEKYFNGGGHKNAAGGEFVGTMDEALAVVDKVIFDLLNKRIN